MVKCNGREMMPFMADRSQISAGLGSRRIRKVLCLCCRRNVNSTVDDRCRDCRTLYRCNGSCLHPQADKSGKGRRGMLCVPGGRWRSRR